MKTIVIPVIVNKVGKILNERSDIESRRLNFNASIMELK
jgi:hypothetical protein